MDVCRGAPMNGSYSKPCPLRADCWRFQHNQEVKRPAGAGLMQGPYDFEIDDCSQFVKGK